MKLNVSSSQGSISIVRQRQNLRALPSIFQKVHAHEMYALLVSAPFLVSAFLVSEPFLVRALFGQSPSGVVALFGQCLSGVRALLVYPDISDIQIFLTSANFLVSVKFWC